MHDRVGCELKVGDAVVILGTVTNLSATPDFCNVTVKSVFGRKPDDMRETFCGNTNVLIKVSE